jgi:hypothetical protein
MEAELCSAETLTLGFHSKEEAAPLPKTMRPGEVLVNT